MSNSSLVSYTQISPNRTSPRNHKIDTITIHCVVGQLSVETIGSIFAPQSREASCNYGIGTDGRIGMYCEEKDRSWCSSNRSNDHRAITIEVACDKTHPYAINNKVYNSLIELLVDICKRNDIKELKWKADKSLIGQVDKQNMTVHRWFANTECPGDYLYNLHGKIAEDVNKKLNVINTQTTGKLYRVRKSWTDSQSQIGAYSNLDNAKNACDDAGGAYYVFDESGKVVYPIATSTSTNFKVGDVVNLTSGAKYTSGKSVPKWVVSSKLYVREIQGDNIVVSLLKVGPITGVVNKKYLSKNVKATTTFKTYKVQVTADALNIRAGAGTNYKIKGTITDKGVYTIVAEENGFGKLKSGAGWISLKYTKKV